MKPAQIIIADDHPLILEGLRLVLAPPHHVVAVARDGHAAVNAALRHQPDLLVLDISMPILNGIDAARRIREKLPQIKLLFITMHVNPSYLQAALELGVIGYVLKSAMAHEIQTAVDQVLRGLTYISPGLGGQAANTSIQRKGIRLTDRERQILQLMAEGRTSKESAQILNVADKTISFHRDNVKNKLGLRSIAELTKYAIEEGMIS